MSKSFIGLLVAIVVVFGGAFFLVNKNSAGGNTTATAKPSENIEGLGKSGVALVEYGDFECPYCEEYAPIVQQVVQNNYSQITFQFRNFPLTSIHPNAFAASRAAEAAALMGKFWQMHDLLYSSSNWQQWNSSPNPYPYFTQYAKQLGLNLTSFNNYFNSNQVNDIIQADMTAGNNLNIQGTPTFYLDGKQIQAGPSITSFEQLISQAIAGKGKVPAAASNAKTAQTKK